MFLGHFAAGFAAKRLVPRTSLGTLFLAAQFADLLWPLLLLAGVETVQVAPGATAAMPLYFENFPISHSLLATVCWALLIMAAHQFMRGDTYATLVLGGLVLSHWLLDAVVHAPDLPIVPGLDYYAGLSLWDSRGATLVVEGLIFALAISSYRNATSSRDGIGRWGLVGLAALLVIIYLASLFGPPPPSGTAIAAAGLAQWLLVAVGYWVDTHRAPRNIWGRHAFR